jgi:hypothetical protein
LPHERAPEGPTGVERRGGISRMRIARAARTARTARTKGGRVSETLRLLQRLAIALVTMVVCAGVPSLARTSASLLVRTVELTAPDSADERGASAPKPAHHLRDGTSRPELQALEPDLDDEDPPCDVLDEPALAFERVPAAPESDCAWRGELPSDTSRFAAGTGLPRGPPA